MISAQDKEIQALVNDIRDGRLLLPEMQRTYVWKSTQVRDLFDSLYRNYPSGQLLVWETDQLPHVRTVSVDEVGTAQRRPQLLLDGQQRLTSLAAVMLGKPLRVQNLKRPIDIAFNFFTEKFEVAGPRQRGQAEWISLSKLFSGSSPVAILRELNLSPHESELAWDRLSKLLSIKTYRYRVNVLEDLTYEEVTHIFVRINSGGTTLGAADLALAQVSSRWRGVSEELDQFGDNLRKLGLSPDTGLMLRTLSVLMTGQSRPSQLFRGDRQSMSLEELKAGWERAKAGLTHAVNFIINNCKVDRPSLLPTNYVLIPLAVFFDRFDSVTPKQSRELQRWVYMALIWSRYSVSAESVADQDAAAILSDDPINNLVQNIEDKVGRRPVTERELRDQRKGSPYLLMAYVLARGNSAEDWFNGVAIGGGQGLELHHIFPKAVLRDHHDLKAESRTVDQVANLAFLSRRANAKISTRAPDEYLQEIDQERLRAQFVPLDPGLWTVNRFPEFLHARRNLLADAINRLLFSLTEAPGLWPSSLVGPLEDRIDRLEDDLRELVASRLLESSGEAAWERHVPPDLRRGLEGRLERYKATTPAAAAQYVGLTGRLKLCQFSDYPKIIAANWALFEDVFGSMKTLDQHYAAATAARNAMKHNRELNRSELAVAEGGLMWLEDCLILARELQAEEG